MAQILNILYKFRLLFTSLILLFSAIITEHNIEVLESTSINTSRFQSVLDKKYRVASENLEEIASLTKEKGLDTFINMDADKYYDVYQDMGIIILVFEEQKLKFWNSNVLPLQINESLLEKEQKIVNTGNGWFALKRLDTNDSITLFGLILIKHEYVFENEFLVNDFHPDFNLFPGAEISFSHHEDNIITCPDRKFLFSLIDPEPAHHHTSYSLAVCFLYALGAILLLLFFYKSFSVFSFKSTTSRNTWFFALTAILIFLRYHMLESGYPEIFKSFSLFHPHHYATSSLFPSLGDFLINAVLILFISICFSAHFKLIDRNTNACRIKSISQVIILSIFLVAFMISFIYMFSGLIFNSNIQLEVHNFFYLNQFSFIAYLILAMLLASLVLIADRVVFIASTLVDFKSFIIIFTGSFIAGIFLYSAAGNNIYIYTILFFVALTGSITGIRYFRYHYAYSFQVFLVFLISVFSLVFITNKSRDKEKDIRQVLAVSLANERDQVAEFLMEENASNLKTDSVIHAELLSMQFDNYELFDYLNINYFDGYFRKYDLQIALCDQNTDLLLEDINEWVECYPFFYNMIDDFGIPVSASSDFFFLDNLNGRISYLGVIIYEFDEYPYEKTLFISLDSKLIDDQLGYPELLLEGKFSSNPALIQYSHAKYNNDQLITRSGTYPYPLTLQFNPEPDEEFVFVKTEGYEHLVYQIDKENVILLSKPETRTIDYLTSFSYNFLFFYLLYSLSLLICKYPVNLRKWQIDFKNKIKYSMIGVLLLSLIIIGVGTVYYNIRQFESKQYENISERIRSVLVELEYRLGMEYELTDQMRPYVTGRLIQLSNVFYTDINLYDLGGNLYASSRPEVFELKLIGEQMNPEAYSEMVLKKKARFVHKESISNLSYLSAYVPLTNADNEILSYLNLPYFTRQSILTKEIYTLVVAVANIYAILILITILIAVIVSNTITKPLQLIQNKLRKLSIGKKNEQIDYVSDDEIGSLIKEYNRMVEELENSTELLARSERESAWREMAKQIAHEIKNPLTPMKLSIQHLQRSWDDRVENWEEVLKKTTRNLVEQIDHLSSIATAFSHFAKLPKATAGKVDIVSAANKVADLFSNTENVDISVKSKGFEKLYVISDKVQLNRIFINLLKNAIQSIPKERKGIIIIELAMEENMALAKIIDNGEGVHPGIRNKMFTPNFTSKSGGTGMGLALVKSIVEQSGGMVGFTSEYKKGSCFFFKIPCASQEPPGV